MSADNKIFIKNMVCDRCIMAVENVFTSLDIPILKVSLGSAKLKNPISSKQESELSKKLSDLGFELLEQPRKILTEKIKNLIIQAVHYSESPIPVNISTYLVEQLRQDYSQLSHFFSDAEGMTIEQFTIAQKIEKAKELLSYDEKTLTEIADQLGYANVSYLSSQFKKITGQTPTQFKLRQHIPRLSLDKVKNR